MTPKEALDRAISAVGSQSAFADALREATHKDIRPGHIYYWLKAVRDGGEVPSAHCPDIEAITKGTSGPVTCEQLCPSVNWAVLRAKQGRTIKAEQGVAPAAAVGG